MSARQILRSSEYLILVRTSVITSLTVDEVSALVVGFSYRGEGKVRRRIRHRARARAFTNARTATRSLDLPLDIGDPPYLFPNPILCLSVGSGQCTPAIVAGFFFDQISASIQNHQRAPGRKRRANGQSEMV
jgi:hypothetical protein